MTKGINEQVNEFRHRPLSNADSIVLCVDALYEKVCVDRRIVRWRYMLCAVWMNTVSELLLQLNPWQKTPEAPMGYGFRT